MEGTSVIANAAMKAKTALDQVEKLTGKLALPAKMCREAWRDFGKALLVIREKLPSNDAFGKAVKEYGLDAGVASASSTRSNAMWLAENWSVLKSFKTDSHHPTYVRQEARNNGLECARPVPKALALVVSNNNTKPENDDEESDDEADEPATKPVASGKPKITGVWKAVELAIDKPLPAGYLRDALSHPKKRKEVEEAYGHPIPKQTAIGSEEAIAIRHVVEDLAAKKHPEMIVPLDGGREDRFEFLAGKATELAAQWDKLLTPKERQWLVINHSPFTLDVDRLIALLDYAAGQSSPPRLTVVK